MLDDSRRCYPAEKSSNTGVHGTFLTEKANEKRYKSGTCTHKLRGIDGRRNDVIRQLVFHITLGISHMSLMPTDLPSFLWGAAVGLLGAFFTGIFSKAGEHAYSAIRSKLFPAPLEPIEVDRRYEPTLFKLGECAWVGELDVSEFEDKGYTHYPHPNGAPKCYRQTSDGRRMYKEFLMVKPGAEKNA